MALARRRGAQAERLAQLLRHATRHVPYYRDLLAAGVVRDDTVDLTCFCHISRLSRDMLRD